MIFNKRQDKSLTSEVLSKLLKNKPALVGLIIILNALVISLLGANIRPDASPDANNQIQQIARQNPGTSILHLKVKKNEFIEDISFFGKMLFGGQKNKHKYVPIYSYKFSNDSIEVEEFTGMIQDENYEPLFTSFHLSNVAYSLSIDVENNYTLNSNNTITCVLLDGSEKTIDIQDLQELVKADNLETKYYLLGTDKHGRDVLSRLMAGNIVSLSVGLIAVFISVFIGLLLGALAGYYRGVVDDVITLFINMIWSIPGLLLVISLSLIIGRGFTTIFFAVGLTMWVELARIVRGQIMSVKELAYVESARALGFSDLRIIWRHIFPNITGSIIVICASNFAAAILIEAGLSFLGIGVQIPMSSWGYMIEQNKGLIMDADKAYLALLPGICIIVLVFAFMMLGNGLRDAFDVKDSSSEGVNV